MRWSTKSGKMEFKEIEKRKLILENAVALLLEFYCGESAFFFLRKAFIPYSPELAAGQMVRFFFLACEDPENNGAFRWYIMFPKTMAQAERLMSGIGCIIKCGAAALLIGAV